MAFPRDAESSKQSHIYNKYLLLSVYKKQRYRNEGNMLRLSHEQYQEGAHLLELAMLVDVLILDFGLFSLIKMSLICLV